MSNVCGTSKPGRASCTRTEIPQSNLCHNWLEPLHASTSVTIRDKYLPQIVDVPSRQCSDRTLLLARRVGILRAIVLSQYLCPHGPCSGSLPTKLVTISRSRRNRPAIWTVNGESTAVHLPRRLRQPLIVWLSRWISLLKYVTLRSLHRTTFQRFSFVHSGTLRRARRS